MLSYFLAVDSCTDEVGVFLLVTPSNASERSLAFNSIARAKSKSKDIEQDIERSHAFNIFAGRYQKKNTNFISVDKSTARNKKVFLHLKELLASIKVKLDPRFFSLSGSDIVVKFRGQRDCHIRVRERFAHKALVKKNLGGEKKKKKKKTSSESQARLHPRGCGAISAILLGHLTIGCLKRMHIKPCCCSS